MLRRRDPASRARPLTTTVHCLCPFGEWMRARAGAEIVKRMPDLALVLEGKTDWTEGGE
jgi:hypothetical protein